MTENCIKIRKIQKGSRRDVFLKKFGKRVEEYDSFKRSVDGLSQGSNNNYSDRLPDFFVFIDEDPDTVITNRIKDIMSADILTAERYERKVKVYVKMLEEKDVSPHSSIGCIQGFFANNNKRLSLDLGNLKIGKGRKKKKYSPSQEDVRKLYSFADCARDRLIIVLGFQHGILPVDMANLVIGDYPEEPWTYFIGHRSKTGEEYHVVSTPDGCNNLKAYLRLRGGKSGEQLLTGRKGSLDAIAIREILDVLIKRAGLDKIPGFMPKCLRDGFADTLIDADVYLQVKEGLMGHGSNIYHQYGSAKKVEERCIESMKKAYPLLCLTDNAAPNGNGDAAQLLKELTILLPDIKELIAQKTQEADKKKDVRVFKDSL
ncbi:MAG: site-specific integrase [Nitrososphaerota archaeon]|nr:site-specific integrase [Nitrososphaerota archaeon]